MYRDLILNASLKVLQNKMLKRSNLRHYVSIPLFVVSSKTRQHTKRNRLKVDKLITEKGRSISFAYCC